MQYDQMRKIMLAVLMAFMAIYCSGGSAVAQSNDVYRGISFIGMQRASNPDVDIASAEFVNAGGNLGISLLPFEFSTANENPFSKIERLVRTVAPSQNVRNLTVVLYMEWFDRDDLGRKAPEEQVLYRSFETGQSSNPRRLFESRVKATLVWVRELQRSSPVIASKCRFVICNVLEDECVTRSAMRAMNDWIRQEAKSAGAAIELRRCHVLDDKEGQSKYPFSPPLAVPSELHGQSLGWITSRAKLVSGDSFSNDGAAVGVEKFIADARTARTRSISSQWWIQAFNGERRDKRGQFIPQNQRIVDPFTNRATGAANRADLKRYLTALK